MRAAAVVSAVVIALRFGTVDASLGLSAQGQATAPAATSENKLNIQGCVFPKRALDSKTPVTALPSGTEDYVLTDTTVISASAGLEIGSGRVFKLDGVEPERLRELIGQRAGVNGRVDMKPEPPVLQVLSIQETVGLCPLVPTQHP